MTREEAARILDPETSMETLAEIEYYAGFSGREAVKKAMHDARVMGAKALRSERPKGRWVEPIECGLPDEFTGVGFDCSNCGLWSDTDYSFCPNCGADMRGEEE